MGKIKYQYYDDCRAYPYYPKEQESIVISEWELEKYSILNGQINGLILTKEAKDFYNSFQSMALKRVGDGYICTSAYKNAESSYKTTISFAMGMLATRIVALKKYDIIHLFHLKDKSIKHEPKNKCIPDWFGVNSYNVPFLFESKGTLDRKIQKNTIEHAKYEQLNLIKKITDNSGGTKTYISKFKRHVIVSCFDDIQNDMWNIQDIDPESEGIVETFINLDKECFKYYRTFLDFLDSYEKPYAKNIVMVDRQEFCFLKDENEMFGIHKKIYDAVVSSKYTEENEYLNFYKDIKKILSEIKCEKYMKDSSSYEDGIIVCSSK